MIKGSIHQENIKIPNVHISNNFKIHDEKTDRTKRRNTNKQYSQGLQHSEKWIELIERKSIRI